MGKHTFNELCALVELPIRTVRYYIQKGLVSPPEGSRKGDYYTQKHLDKLLAIRKWQRAGLSLKQIKRASFRGDRRTWSVAATTGTQTR